MGLTNRRIADCPCSWIIRQSSGGALVSVQDSATSTERPDAAESRRDIQKLALKARDARHDGNRLSMCRCGVGANHDAAKAARVLYHLVEKAAGGVSNTKDLLAVCA